MFQTKFVCVFLQGHADRSCRQRLVGVITAPNAVDGVQISRGNGAVRFQTDVSLRAQEQQHIVRIPPCLFSVVLGAAAFGKEIVVCDQPTQALQTPQKNPLDLRNELVCKKRIVLTVKRFLFDRKNKLSAVKTV